MFMRVNWHRQAVLSSTEGYVTSWKPTIALQHALMPRKKIEHAGFYRDIISRNPPLVDEDGYEVDSEDDDERAQAASTAAAEFNPYANVKIESINTPDVTERSH